ncbi:hypothetical protein [Planomonospora algeriensis]
MSGRYDRSERGSGAGPVTERTMWDAIDRGADPTDDPAGDRVGDRVGDRDGGPSDGAPGDRGAGSSGDSFPSPAGGPVRGER